jgi:hypothetical protein
MQGVKVDEALVQRLEKESLQLANDIKEKEVENELLREQINTLFTLSNKMKDELSKVSGLLMCCNCLCITLSTQITHTLIDDYTAFQLQGQTTNEQKSKVQLIIECRKLSNDNEARGIHISELKAQLKKLRMKTFPCITMAEK